MGGFLENFENDRDSKVVNLECCQIQRFLNFWGGNDREAKRGNRQGLKWCKMTEIMIGGSGGEYGKFCPGTNLYTTTDGKDGNVLQNH